MIVQGRMSLPPSLVNDHSLLGHGRAGGTIQAHPMQSKLNTESMHAFKAIKAALLCSCILVLDLHLLSLSWLLQPVSVFLVSMPVSFWLTISSCNFRCAKADAVHVFQNSGALMYTSKSI